VQLRPAREITLGGSSSAAKRADKQGRLDSKNCKESPGSRTFKVNGNLLGRRSGGAAQEFGKGQKVTSSRGSFAHRKKEDEAMRNHRM